MQQEKSFVIASRLLMRQDNLEKWPKLLYFIVLLLFAVTEW